MISTTKRRLVSLASTSAIIAIMAVTAATPAFAGSAPKTTGDVWADRTADGVGMAHMVFVVQGTDPAKGTFTYSDDDGAYTIDIQAVEIDDSVGHFAGQIVSNTYPGFEVGWYVGIAVKDGGEPGIGVDKINGATYGTLEAAIAGFNTLEPNYLTASAGNLQVHDHS